MDPSEIQNLTSNKALDATAQFAQREPAMSVEDYAKSIGVQTQPEQKQAPAQQPQLINPSAGSNQQSVGSDVGGMVKGAAQGLADVTQNVLNFGVGIAAGVDKFAADHGVGRGDLITNADQFDFAKKLGSPDDSFVTRATREIVKYSAPVLAALPTAGAGMALGVGAAADLLTLDPHQQRLSSILMNEVPELKNFPIAYHALDYLKNKPNEGEFEGRFKNALEGLGLGAGMAMTFAGISKAARALRPVGAQVADAARIAAAPEHVVAAAQAPIMSEAELAAKESQMGLNASAEPLQGDLYNYAATKTAADGLPRFNLNNENVVRYASQYAQAFPQDLENIFRGTKSGQELSAEAKSVLTDQDKLNSLLSWKLGDRPLTDAETKASQYLMRNTYTEVADAAAKATESEHPADLLHLSNMIDTFKFVNNAKEGAGAEAGRALNAHKLNADLVGLDVEEYNKVLGDKGRAQLLADALKASGGQDNILEMAKQIKAISEVPDADVAGALLKTSKSGFQKTADILQSVAFNGMLSSPKGVVAKLTSTTLSSAGSALENYVAAGLGALRKDPADVVRFSDANNYLHGMMSSLMEGVKAVGTAFKTAKSPFSTINGDMVRQANPLSAQALGIPIEQSLGYRMLGHVADASGMAVGLPSRIHTSADAFWGQILYRGKLYEEAAGTAEKLGLKGQEASDFMAKRLANPSQDLHESSVDFAQKNTFGSALDPASTLGKVNDLINTVPGGRVVFPFFRINGNFINYTFEHSPLALFSGPIRESIVRGGKEGDLAAARVVMGSSMLGMSAYLASQGIITGPDTENPKAKRALEESGQGWQADSVKIGDTFASYRRIEPMASVLRLGAVTSQLRNYLPDGEYQSLAAVAGGALADFMTPEMMVDSYSKFFDSYSQSLKYDSSKKEIASSFMADIASRFTPYGGLQKDIKNEIDPYKGSTMIQSNPGWLNNFTDKIIAKYKSISPWLSTDLPIERNIFGEPLKVPDGLGPDLISPFATSKAGNTDVVRKLSELSGVYEQLSPHNPDLNQLSISMPPKSFSFKGINMDLSPAEYEKYVLYSAGLSPETGKPLAGESLRSAMEDTLKGVSSIGVDISPLEYNKIVGKLSGVILKYRQMGQQMMLQDPQIMDRWQKAQEATMQRQQINTFQ